MHLPIDALWRAEFLAEIAGFPNSRFDDQVDAFSQLINWVRKQDMFPAGALVAPTIFWEDEDGNIRNSDDDGSDDSDYDSDDPGLY